MNAVKKENPRLYQCIRMYYPYAIGRQRVIVNGWSGYYTYCGADLLRFTIHLDTPYLSNDYFTWVMITLPE